MLKPGMWQKLFHWITGNVKYWRNRLSKWTRTFYAAQHQLTSTTSFDRYPELFRSIQQLMGSEFKGQTVKLLSFGCSTGEECFTLNSYFKKASIVGVDINKANIMMAQRVNQFDNIKFLLSSPETILRKGKYHAIFCLSVLCRWEDTKGLENCGSVYPFVKFEQTVSMLAKQLLPGGFLVIYNSNFRFEDTSTCRDFEIIATPGVDSSGFVDKFDTNNVRLADMAHQHCVYRKLR